MAWQGTANLSPEQFTCGFCSREVASVTGYFDPDSKTNPGRVYICPNCNRPNFFDRSSKQYPGPPFGNQVDHINDSSVADLYEEARRCFSVGAFTSAVMCCRKLLMNIAASKGAPEGQTFARYVEYLATHNYVPPDAKAWVDHIRQMGNEANHEIALKSKVDAAEAISFVEMLLKLVYEFPARIKPQP